jgi:DNA-binding PadR family transcriptional regulator
MTTNVRRSPLAMAVLGLLEDGPLHPYGMQQLIRKWGKDEVINVGQRATLYKIISRLCEAELIRATGTTRDHLYPERTSYELTETGRQVRQQWIAEVLSTPRNEFPEFPAALSFLPLVDPQAAAELLGTRRDLLAHRLADRDALVAQAGVGLPQVSLLETEYLHAVVNAEIRWIDDVLTGLRDGSITWSATQMHDVASRLDD